MCKVLNLRRWALAHQCTPLSTTETERDRPGTICYKATSEGKICANCSGRVKELLAPLGYYIRLFRSPEHTWLKAFDSACFRTPLHGTWSTQWDKVTSDDHGHLAGGDGWCQTKHKRRNKPTHLPTLQKLFRLFTKSFLLKTLRK